MLEIVVQSPALVCCILLIYKKRAEATRSAVSGLYEGRRSRSPLAGRGPYYGAGNEHGLFFYPLFSCGVLGPGYRVASRSHYAATFYANTSSRKAVTASQYSLLSTAD